MLVGPAKVFFMDEISTGLDSSTTFQICKFLRQMIHTMEVTMLVSLLQPAPETYELFDDIILLSEGQIVYQGPREHVLEFFENMGFKCPERKGVADFLQEVTSKKDQQQYWSRRNEPYRYVSVPEFAGSFHLFYVGKKLASEIKVPYDKSQTNEAALVKKKYGISNWELLKACFSREWLFMKRDIFVYIYRIVHLTVLSILGFTVFFRTEMPVGTVENGQKFYGALFFTLFNMMFNGSSEQAMIVSRLPVFYKQRDFMFYPAWAFALPVWILRIPISFLESGIWIALTYYTTGFAPSSSSASIVNYVSYILQPNTDPRIGATTVGKVLLKSKGFFTEEYWFWICIGALFGFALLFNLLFIMFVEEVMEWVELKPIKDALVGLPGIDGLSTEQRKRLTIAVELVANPSIILMDEPTSGLDARAAAIVMRTVRKTVDTGRTVVCTIHQPSIDIFEAFDEVSLEYETISLYV
ncbi:hypothetical protein JHK85_008173 [Glycine max]|nr:hypothetical protein JHK85_008173 [Glycine max]